MKKFTYLLAALAVAGSAFAQQARHYRMVERNAPQVIVEEAIQNQRPTAAQLKAMKPVGGVEVKYELGARIENSRDLSTVGSNYQPLAAQYRVNETFDSFTKGSLESPVKMPSGNVAGLDSELRFYGLWDAGNGWALINQQTGVDRDAIVWVDHIDLSRGAVTAFSFDVAAAAANSVITLALYDMDGKQALDMFSVDLPADGYFYPLSVNAIPQTAGYSNISIAIMEDSTLPFLIDNIVVDAIFNDKWKPDEDDPTPAPTTAPSNITTQVARSKQSFTVNYTAAKGATHHQVLCYDDVYTYDGLQSFDYINADLSNYTSAKTDPYDPDFVAYSRDAHAASFPCTDLHYPVVINGALGFGHHPQLFDENGVMAGFETATYDLSPTNGVVTIKFNYFATIGTGIYFAEVAWNDRTGGWDIVDDFSADGHFDEAGNNNGLCWHQDDPWDYLEITTEALDMSKYSGEVYFCLYLYSVMTYDDLELMGFDSTETAPATVPVFFYMTDFNIKSNNLPGGEWFYYPYKDPIQAGNGAISIAGDVPNRNFNVFVRGINIVTSGAQAGTAYGPWGGDENGEPVYVHELVPDLGGVNEIVADKAENAEYYNLQGMRVANPEKGIFIRKANGKTEKVVK